MGLRYIHQVLRIHIVPYFGRHQHHMCQQNNTHANSARATKDFLQQHNIRIMPWPILSPDLNPTVHLWDEIQRKFIATKADNCSRSECSFSQDVGRDCCGLYQPSYSPHVQEMRVCGQRSWGTHAVLTRNAPSDVCDYMCTSGN